MGVASGCSRTSYTWSGRRPVTLYYGSMESVSPLPIYRFSTALKRLEAGCGKTMLW